MIEFIASDMDGTLLIDHANLHKDNIEAIKHIQNLGVPFVICTGRDLAQARFCLEPADISCPLITLNGAETYDENGKLIETIGIEDDDARELMNLAEDLGLYTEIMTSKGVFTLNLSRRVAQLVDMQRKLQPDMAEEEIHEHIQHFTDTLLAKEIASYEELYRDPHTIVLKLCIFSNDGQVAFEGLKKHASKHLPNVVITSSFYNNIEVNHVNAQKGIALKKYANKFGYDLDKTMAIGDNGNDISMLSIVEYSYAMENAEDYVKDVANYITGKNSEGGVAQAIYKHFPTK